MSRSFQRIVHAWPNLLVLSYTLVGWVLGVWLLTRPEVWLNAVGVLLTAHALTYSAYLIHDCAHQSVFVSTSSNDCLGVLMSWINGACVASYSGLKKKHLRHIAGEGGILGRVENTDAVVTAWSA